MGKIKDNKKTQSIFRRLIVPITILLVVQSLLFMAVVLRSGVINRLNASAYESISVQVDNWKNNLQTQLTVHWSSMDAMATAVDEAHRSHPGNDANSQQELLNQMRTPLITLLRQNEVNGAFIILTGGNNATSIKDGETMERYGLCIRDLDQFGEYAGTEDLQVERAPVSQVANMGISLANTWENCYRFTNKTENEYYFKPLEAALKNPGVDPENMEYWCDLHQIAEGDVQMFSYSIPLIGDDGKPYGVLGIEMTVDAMMTAFPEAALGDRASSSFVLAKADNAEKTSFEMYGSNTPFCKAATGGKEISLGDEEADQTYLVNTENVPYKVCASLSYLDLYSNASIYSDEDNFVVMGVINQEKLLSSSAYINKMLLAITAISLTIGIIGLFFISRQFANPIKALSKKVQGMDEHSALELDRLGITEIDQLIDSIEQLSHTVSRNQARTAFFSRMSHDMRTPMNAILGFSNETMLAGTTEEEKVEYLHQIHTSGEYLLELINEILDMAKIEDDTMSLNPEPMAVAKLADDTQPIIAEVARQQKINFVIDNPLKQDTRMVSLDRQRFQQILVNLLSNAVKFTPEDGTVTLSFEGGDDTSSKQLPLTILVSDTGIGMGEGFQKSLFQPFTQENPSNKEGTGLGLSITKRLVDLMGGTITCDSTPGEGTCFTIKLKLECLDQRVEQQPEEQAALPEPEKKTADINTDILKGRHILLCEDHPVNRQIAMKLLQKVGITVTSAENGQIGVDTFKAEPPNTFDVVLMDIRMPVMDGLDATRGIRAVEAERQAEDGQAAHIPIIALTANAFQEDLDNCMEAGMDAHLAKPVIPADLYRVLGEYINQNAETNDQ